MRNITVLILLLFMASAACFAGTLDIEARAGAFTGSDADSTSMMYGVAADYDLTRNISLRGAVETTSYTVGGQQVTYMPVTVDIIYGQEILPGVRPYAGIGLSYNSKTMGGVTNQTTGAQTEVGIKYTLRGFSAGIEYRYMIPDLENSTVVNSTYNAYATGRVSQSIDL